MIRITVSKRASNLSLLIKHHVTKIHTHHKPAWEGNTLRHCLSKKVLEHFISYVLSCDGKPSKVLLFHFIISILQHVPKSCMIQINDVTFYMICDLLSTHLYLLSRITYRNIFSKRCYIQVCPYIRKEKNKNAIGNVTFILLLPSATFVFHSL